MDVCMSIRRGHVCVGGKGGVHQWHVVLLVSSLYRPSLHALAPSLPAYLMRVLT
jgi:hypothetical protein